MNTEYHVYMPNLLGCAADLEQAARRQKRALADLRDTRNRLKRLSYMDEVIRQLRRREEWMEHRLQKILRMAQALRRIHQILTRMENEVIDGIELPPPVYRGHGRRPRHPGWRWHPRRPPVCHYPPPPGSQMELNITVGDFVFPDDDCYAVEGTRACQVVYFCSTPTNDDTLFTLSDDEFFVSHSISDR